MSVSKRDSLKPQAPARANGATWSRPPRFASVASSATSTTASTATRSRLAAKRSALLIGAPASKGISMIVVTPPAAAALVAAVMPSVGSDRQCTCASTAPGSTSEPAASMTRAASHSPSTAPAATMRPSRTTTAPSTVSPPGNTTVPRTIRSTRSIPLLPCQLYRGAYPRLCCQRPHLLAHSGAATTSRQPRRGDGACHAAADQQAVGEWRPTLARLLRSPLLGASDSAPQLGPDAGDHLGGRQRARPVGAIASHSGRVDAHLRGDAV